MVLTTKKAPLHIDIPNGHYRNQIDDILINKRWRSSKQAAKTFPDADCGSDHELLVCKLKVNLKGIVKKSIKKIELQDTPLEFKKEANDQFARISTSAEAEEGANKLRNTLKNVVLTLLPQRNIFLRRKPRK